MDRSLFVLSPVYVIFGLAILALVARELLPMTLSIRRRRHHRHHHRPHRHAA